MHTTRAHRKRSALDRLTNINKKWDTPWIIGLTDLEDDITDGTADATAEGTTEGTTEGRVEGAMDGAADGGPDAIGVVNKLGYVEGRERGAATLAASSISHSSMTELESRNEVSMVLSELYELVEALEGVRVKLVGPGGLRYRREGVSGPGVEEEGGNVTGDNDASGHDTGDSVGRSS